MDYIALDTNILLLDAHNIEVIGRGATIVLAETVLSEIDNKKTGLGEVAYQAREFARILSEAEIVDMVNVNENTKAVRLALASGVEIVTVSLERYESNTNDKKIIEAILNYEVAIPGSRKLQFITNDVMCKLIAISKGLNTISLRQNTEVSYEFNKTIEVPTDLFKNIHKKDILEVDHDYLPGNYNYIIKDMETGQSKLATVQNRVLYVLGKETEQELRKQIAPAINKEQLYAARAILDPAVDVVVLEGPAGTGKNICAFSNAIQLLKTNRSKYNGIVYVRVPINDEEKGEDIGYLATNDAKLNLYMGPLNSSLYFLAKKLVNEKKYKGKNLEDKINETILDITSNCNITSQISTGTRGITYDSQILIFDEMSNASPGTMQKLLTRVGKDCKVIIIGSLLQIDNPYITKYNNGLAMIMNELHRKTIDTSLKMCAINLTKIVRSEIANFAEKLFSKVI